MTARATGLRKSMNKSFKAACRGPNQETTRVQSLLEPRAGARPHSQGEVWGPPRWPAALYDQDLAQVYADKGTELQGPFSKPRGTHGLKNELREVREELKEKIEEIKQIKDIMNKDFEKLQEFVDLLKGMQQDMDDKMDALLDIQQHPQQSGPVCAPRPLRKSPKAPWTLMGKTDAGHPAAPVLHQRGSQTRPRRDPPGSCHPLGTCEECSVCAPKNDYNQCSKEPQSAWLPYSLLASGAAL